MSRPLPHNEEAEAAVLGGILIRNELLHDVVWTLADDDFFHPGHRAVFRAMKALLACGESSDIVKLERQLRDTDELSLIGGLEGLGRLGDRYAMSHNVLSHAQMVRDAAAIRNLVRTAQEVAEEGREPVVDARAFLASAGKRLLEAGQGGRKGGYRPARDFIAEVFDGLAERASQEGVVSGVSTGFAELDELTGGLQAGDLVILAARPSMGKTALAMNLAQSVCMPSDPSRPAAPVLFFSLEMTSAQLLERLLSGLTMVDVERIRRGQLDEDEFERLLEATETIASAPLHIDETSASTITELRSRARAFRQAPALFPDGTSKRAPGLIVVDYLQLCRAAAGRAEVREQEISEVSRGLKAMAKELQLPILALSQLNRSVDHRADHRPVLADLRESGAIEQDADLILFLYREEVYRTDAAARREVEGQADLIIGKHRNGPCGTVRLEFRGEHARFYEPSPV